MKTLPFLVGIAAAAAVLFVTYTQGGYRSRTTFYAASIASTYVVFSILAFTVTRFGNKNKGRKAWAFFASGIVLLFGYLPSVRFIVRVFYIPDSDYSMRVDQELFFFAPMIVSALCIYRAVSLWAEESLERKAPNKAPEPTPGAVTPRATKGASK